MDAPDVEQVAHDVHRSDAVEGLARLGLAARGLVWLVIGVLGVTLVAGGQAQADQQGALRAIADKPFGEVLLVVLVVGFLGHALWQGLVAAVGRDDLRPRLQSAGKTVLYAGLAVSVVRFLATGQRSGGDPTPSVTARVMEQPGGRTVVGLAGVAVLALGVYLVVKALRCSHARKIEQWRLPAGLRRTAVRVGTAGLLGRALVLGLVGVFVLTAAVQADPEEARGLDAALHELAQQPYGRLLLAVAVAGVLAYAAWSFLQAALHRHEPEAA